MLPVVHDETVRATLVYLSVIMFPVVHDNTFSVTLVYFIYNYVAGRAWRIY